MDKKSKVLLICFIVIVMVAIGICYEKFINKEDFFVETLEGGPIIEVEE